jgi:hypothetical protein
MRKFLASAAVLAWIFGLVLLLAPTKFYEPTGITLMPMLATLAQAHDATLFGLGLINRCARHRRSRALRSVARNFVVQTLSLLIVIRTMMLGAGTSVARWRARL